MRNKINKEETCCKRYKAQSAGPAEQLQSAGADAPLLKCSWEKGGGGWWLWGCNVDFKEGLPGADSIFFLIQLQLINHFLLNSLANEKGVSNKKSVTMHSSIITDFRAFHLLQKFVRSLLAALFRTFLQLLVNRALFLTFELPKRTFSCSEGCRIYQQKLADREKGSFIMLC